MTPELAVPSAAQEILRPLAKKAAELKLPVYAVGGCVRDWILDAPSYDLDLVFRGDPAPVARYCAKMLGAKPQAFDRFGTLRVISGDRWRVDFATSRREAYPKPASLPVVKPAPLKEDLFRRDFTINAMAARLHADGAGELVDPYGGLKDLRGGVLRPLHESSFRDDPTRVFRAARFLCRLKLKPAPGMPGMARTALDRGHAALLSRHRLMQELLRVLAEKGPACALNFLREWGYLDLIHPGLQAPPAEFHSVEERLGGMALFLGPAEGLRFLKSLPLERGVSSGLREILKLAQEKASPRGPIPPVALKLLSRHFPRLAEGALRPLWLDGEDLKAAGVKPGIKFREILDDAAKAQWEGEISSRAQALRWLKEWLELERD